VTSRRERRPARVPPVLLSVALVVLIALAYSAVRHHDFVPIDDPAYVSENPHVLGGLTWQNVSWAFTARWASYWIPLTWISYMADVQIFGAQPGALHLSNLLLHVLNTLLLFTWLRRTTGAVGRSVFVAALFAVHPLHVESVAWITERKDVLSTLFLLLALLVYAAYVRRPTLPRYVAVGLCFVAGILAKPMLVTLPFILMLCDVWPLGRVTLDARTGWAASVREKWPLFAIAAGASAVAFITQDRGGAMVASQVFPIGLRVENALVSYILYIWQTVWPVGLILNYPYPSSIPIWQAGGAAALLAGVSWLALRSARARPWLAMGWLWFVGTLVPVIGLVQVGLQPRADRFTYVPLIGIFIIVAWSATELAARRSLRTPWLVGAAIVTTLLCTAASRRQVDYWKDGVALWGRAVAVTPPGEAAQPQFELGAELLRQGHVSDAIPHLVEAIRAQPSFTGAHAALGDAWSRDGHTAEARAEYEEALRLDASLPQIHNNLGAILATDGRIAEALPHFEAAVRLKPDLESAQVNLGIVYARLGRKDDAMRALSIALQLNPGNAQAQHVLELLRKQ
jgi:Tfp pilus assembly protein PilF